MNLQHYPSPTSRLPFINAEIAHVRRGGREALLSSIWGGPGGGRLVLWEPESREVVQYELPDDIPGAYMLSPGPEGRLYVGCGNGDLLRLDVDSGRFEVLVRGELSSITWAGCVTDRYVVQTASPGDLLMWDHRSESIAKIFRPLDSGHDPHARYGRRIFELPDGRIFIQMASPQARLFTIDPETLDATEHTPGELMGHVFNFGARLLSDGAVATMLPDTSCMLLAPKTLDWAARVAPIEPGAHAYAPTAVLDGELLAWHGQRLVRLDREARRWETLCEPIGQPGWCTMRGIDGGPLAGLWLLHVDGRVLRWRPGLGVVDEIDLDVTGPMEVHSFCPVPQRKLLLGAPFINMRFWWLDMETGLGADGGLACPSGGQVNEIAWDEPTGQGLLASYADAAVALYDPDAGGTFPQNPRLGAMARGENQMRPVGQHHDGRYFWMITTPSYGTLGGALCRFDPQSEEMKVWANLSPDRTPLTLACQAQARLLYLGTTVIGDCDSAGRTQQTAELLAFDANALEVLARTETPGQITAHVLGVTPDGEALVLAGEKLLRWSARRAGPELLRPRPGRSGMVWMIPSPDGPDLACIQGHLYVVQWEPELRFGLIWRDFCTPPGQHNRPRIVGGKLWATRRTEVIAADLAEIASLPVERWV